MSDFDIEKFPTSESGQRMLGYVSSDFYEKSYVGKWLYQIMGMEWDDARKIFEELPLQMFPETATWGLKYHEQKWQLPVRENLSYDERRQLIYQKRNCRTPMTPYRMEKHLESVTGFEVHVNDINDKGEFGLEFTDPNIFAVTVIGNSSLEPEDVGGVIDALKQSHTMYVLNLINGRYEVGHCTYSAVVSQTKKTYVVEVL